MQVIDRTNLNSYTRQLAFLDQIKSCQSYRKKWEIAENNLNPLVKTSGELIPTDGEDIGIQSIGYEYCMGLVVDQKKPQLMLFLTPELAPFAYVVMDFEQDQEHLDLFESEFPKFKYDDHFGYYNHFFFCMWKHPKWQTYPLKIYDGNKDVIFDGEYVHRCADNGDSVRELKDKDGWTSGIELDDLIINPMLDQVIEQFKTGKIIQANNSSTTLFQLEFK